MVDQVLHRIPPAPTIQDYLQRLWLSIINAEEIIVFEKPAVRALYKRAYPRAKV